MKKVIALLLALALCVALCACGISKEDVVGGWAGSYTYNGDSFSVGLVLTEDGEYSKVIYKNGSPSSSESGTYEIDGDEVVLHENGKSGTSTRYEYDDGALVNNGHKLERVD